jgi:membrane-bound serine protease (ClpP class)
VVGASAVLSTLGGLLALRLLPSRAGPRFLVLRNSLARSDGYSSHHATQAAEPPVGSVGTALTHLRPSGKIRVEGRRLDAVSEGDYIDEGLRVRIVAWRAGAAVVRAEAEGETSVDGEEESR